MIFRNRRDRAPEDPWKAHADRLGLRREAGGEALLRELLDLPDEVALGPVYRVEQAGEVRVFIFERREEPSGAGREATVVTACLLVSPKPVSPVSLRASRKLHKVLASLQASASGGELVEVPDGDEFNERVTVVAREVERAAQLLTPPVRRVLERALCRFSAAPTLLVSERHLMLSVRGEQTRFEALEFLLADLLGLYAALAGPD